jgi:hypothetical protein
MMDRSVAPPMAAVVACPSRLAFPGPEGCCDVAFIGANFGVETGVPEPGTRATLAASLATLGAKLRRRRA